MRPSGKGPRDVLFGKLKEYRVRAPREGVLAKLQQIIAIYFGKMVAVSK
jgi:hypothetical protein